MAQPKTKELLAAIARWGVDPETKILLILTERTENIFLSARNVAKLTLIAADQLNIFDLLHADKIVLTEDAVARIQEVYGA